ncbi:MAG: hypothetical protein ABJA67_04090 [Chthonomonadales bacterium]
MELQNSQPEEAVVVAPEPSKLRIKTDKKGKHVAEITREEAIANLKKASEKKRRRKKIRGIIIGVYVGIILILLLVYLYKSITTGDWSHFNDKWFHFFNFFNVLSATGAMSFEQKQTAKALAELGDLDTVGVLIEAWNSDARKSEDVERNTLLEQALEKLLPQLNESNKNLLEPHQRESLFEILRHNPVRLTRLIIACLKEIGGEDAIKPLEKFANRDPDTRVDKAVCEIAKEALIVIKARVEKQREANTLLRPSSANDVAADRYLRPADFTETDSDNLLRPAGPE